MDRLRKRLSALRRVCRGARVEAMLLTSREHVRYFSGFTGEDSYLLVGRGWVTLLTDSRFTEQARMECSGIRTITRRHTMLRAIRKELSARRVRRLGIEGGAVSCTLQANLARGLRGVRLKALSGEIPGLREVKDPGELSAIRKAVRVAEGAMRELLTAGRRSFLGRTERQVAAELEYRMRLRGAERSAFETIVAAGANAAMPHYRPGGRRIRAGEAVLIDWGAVVDGYCSDLTRVYFTGRIPSPIARVYEIVLRAQRAGMKALRARATCASSDAAARRVISEAGYGEHFGHGLGHGLGLEVHEGPRVGSRCRQRLRAGMVVTVEPGIYLPGVGGVRIEDDVLITTDGPRRLSRLPRRLSDALLR